MSKIVFYGLKSESLTQKDNGDFISLESKVNFKLFDTEEERKTYIDFLQKNCASFDITEDIMNTLGFSTKEQVYAQLKKEHTNAIKKVQESMKKQFGVD